MGRSDALGPRLKLGSRPLKAVIAVPHAAGRERREAHVVFAVRCGDHDRCRTRVLEDDPLEPCEARRIQVFDDLDDRFRNMETVRVTKIEWLVGDIRLEFGNLMRAFRARGGRMVVDGKDQEPP